MILATVVNYLLKQETFYHSLFGLIFFVSLYIIAKVIKYFKNPAQTSFVFMAVILFVLSVCLNAILSINHILNEDLSKIERYKITLSENINIDQKNLILLSSNSNYFFFYDKKIRKTIIVPSKKIMVIESEMKKKKSIIYKLLIEHFTSSN